ncbi:MAG: hypothetical protein JWM74_1368 [Myxococcaceae bacterium]|nr:hypothetical protein [Myxococcaceae bacterium]
MGIPLHMTMQGMPMLIMRIIMSQRSFIMSIVMPSIGIIFMVMPSFVISQDILHIMGGIIMGIIPFMPIMFGIMFGIMPFMPFMPFIGIIIGIIMGMGMGMGIGIGIMFPIMFGIMLGIMFGIMWFGMDMAFIVETSVGIVTGIGHRRRLGGLGLPRFRPRLGVLSSAPADGW